MPSPQRQLFDTEPEPWEADDRVKPADVGTRAHVDWSSMGDRRQ